MDSSRSVVDAFEQPLVLITALSNRLSEQVYEEDITYNHHLDAYMNQKNARVLTVLAYVNPNWSEPDKGQLRVFQSGLPHVDYAPLAGRVVLFKSREVFHAVMPSTFQRCAIQLWLMGD